METRQTAQTTTFGMTGSEVQAIGNAAGLNEIGK